MKVLFTYLTCFKGHGGIEKFNKAFLKALIGSPVQIDLRIHSPYDKKPDESYTGKSIFKGYDGNRLLYIIQTVRRAISADVLIVGHINLALVGVTAKLLKPKLKVILITHGIDVWYRLSKVKSALLAKADVVLSVSSFTKQKLITEHQVLPQKVKVFPNTLDPYFSFPEIFNKPTFILQRYSISDQAPVILSLCRLSAKEGYKGYDTVIHALPQVVSRFAKLKYVIVGKYDQKEYQRVTSLAKQLGVEQNVILTNFVADDELTDHYLLADLFVMPSREEGFGIVYIEAMGCGVPVIAGNIDGSVDALDHGALGILVNPLDVEEVANAIISSLSRETCAEQKKDLQERVITKFGFNKFAERLHHILHSLEN